MTCKTCPFAMTEESERVQNWGCLPCEFEIMQVKRETDKNWSCHMDETRMCSGFVEAARELGLDYKTGPLASYHRWYHDGKP